MGGLPGNYEGIKASIIGCFILILFSALSPEFHEWKVPFLELGPISIHTLQITLLCLSLYFTVTFIIEWSKFDTETKQKKAWLADFWLTIFIVLLCIAFTIYKLFIEPSGWSLKLSFYDVIAVILLVAVGEFVATTTDTAIWNLKFIRDKEEAEAKNLPRFPVVVKSTLMSLPINALITALTALASIYHIREPVKSYWYYFYVAPILIHFIFGAFKPKTANIEKLKQAIEWHDTMYVTGGGAHYSLENETLLYEAAQKRRLDEVRRYLESGMDPNEISTMGWTPLMIAAAEGHLEVVRLFIHYGADVKRANTLRRTALMFTAQYGFLEITRLLLEAGADPNVNDIQKSGTALSAASSFGHQEIVELLLGHGADPQIKDEEGKTALDHAQENGHGEIARILRLALQQG